MKENDQARLRLAFQPHYFIDELIVRSSMDTVHIPEETTRSRETSIRLHGSSPAQLPSHYNREPSFILLPSLCDTVAVTTMKFPFSFITC